MPCVTTTSHIGWRFLWVTMYVLWQGCGEHIPQLARAIAQPPSLTCSLVPRAQASRLREGKGVFPYCMRRKAGGSLGTRLANVCMPCFPQCLTSGLQLVKPGGGAKVPVEACFICVDPNFYFHPVNMYMGMLKT